MVIIKSFGISLIFVALTSLAFGQSNPQLPAQLTTKPQMTVEYSIKAQPTKALECTGDPMICKDHRAASGTCPATLEMDVYLNVEPTSNYIYYPQVSDLGIVVNTSSGTFVGALNNGAGSLNTTGYLPIVFVNFSANVTVGSN